MKKLSMLLVAVMSVVVLSGVATAYTWTDTINPDDFIINGSTPYSYTHDLTNNSSPFVPGTDFISGYSLKIRLYDDRDGDRETAYVNLPGLFDGGKYDFSLANNDFGWSLLGWISLNALGKYDVTISATKGDFYFDYSTLVADGCYNSVPEPTTMLLLGLGLVGLAGFGRKKFNS